MGYKTAMVDDDEQLTYLTKMVKEWSKDRGVGLEERDLRFGCFSEPEKVMS